MQILCANVLADPFDDLLPKRRFDIVTIAYTCRLSL